MHLLSRCSAALLCCLLTLPLSAQSTSTPSAPVEAYTLDLSQGSATTAQVRLLPAELKAGLKTLVLTGTLSSDRMVTFVKSAISAPMLRCSTSVQPLALKFLTMLS